MARAFVYADFLEQIRTVRKLGPLSELIKTIPGLARFADQVRGDELEVYEKILSGMTPSELRVPELLEGERGAARREALAARSGVEPEEVDRFVNTFPSVQDALARLGGEKTQE